MGSRSESQTEMKPEEEAGGRLSRRKKRGRLSQRKKRGGLSQRKKREEG